MLRGRLLLGLLALVSSIGLGVAAARPAAAVDPGGVWLAKINGLRSARGLQGLTPDSQASSVAQAWTDHMARTGTLAHNPDVSRQVTADWTRIGENVGYGGTVDSLFSAFVASPSHLANLVQPAYNRVGIGHAVDGRGRIWTTHVFLTATSPLPAPELVCSAPKAATGSAVALRRGTTWFLENGLTGGAADSCFRFGDAGDQPVFGDWNGDGVRTPGVFRAATGTWYLSDRLDGSLVNRVIAMGGPGDRALVGDFNDDGVAGIGVFRPSNGTFYLSNRLSSGPAEGAVVFGSPGDVPVIGDWNVDGTDTLGVFRPSTGTWFLTDRFDNRVDRAFQLGGPGDVPVVGDWNDDGRDTAGVFRPGNGTWYATNVLGRTWAELSFGFGQPGDVPLVRS